jgi:hypothetical protein
VLPQLHVCRSKLRALMAQMHFHVTGSDTSPKIRGNLEKYLMTLDVKPEIAAALQALASAKGLSVEDYLEQLVENQLPRKLEDATRSEDSGMVWENGLFIYRTGRPLPSRVVDDAIRQVREERAQHSNNQSGGPSLTPRSYSKPPALPLRTVLQFCSLGQLSWTYLFSTIGHDCRTPPRLSAP